MSAIEDIPTITQNLRMTAIAAKEPFSHHTMRVPGQFDDTNDWFILKVDIRNVNSNKKIYLKADIVIISVRCKLNC